MPVKITKEDDLLLEHYSRSTSAKSNKLIYGLYWRIHEMDFFSYLYLFVIVTGISTYLISLSYGNSKKPLQERIAIKRTDAVTKSMTKELGVNKISREDRNDMIRHRVKMVSEYESTTFSIFYINALFFLILLVVSTIVHQFSLPANYIVSMLISSGSTVFLSSSKSK